MAPPKKGKGIVSSGAMSSKASPLPDRKNKEPLAPLTPVEAIQRELSRPGYKTPLALLNERCQRNNWERANINCHTNPDGKTFTPSVSLARHVKKSQNSPIESVIFRPHPALTCETMLEARHMGAVYALFRFCSDQPISLTLPPYFRPYWTTLLADKATAPPHRAWEFTTDPFTAQKAVSARQDKRAVETTRREGLANGDQSSGRSTPSSSGGGGGGGGGPMLSGEWERAPEVRMAPALRELVEETIRDQMTKYPDAILQATRESTGGKSEAQQEIQIDVRSLSVSLEGLGFRPSHVRSVTQFLMNALERIHNPTKKDRESLDPLVLALSTLSPQEAAIEWLILHLPEDDLPKRFCPAASVADFVSSSRAGNGVSLVQTWLVDKLIKVIGFPRKAVELVLKEDIGTGSPWSESGALDVLSRRMCGWEDGDWGVEAVLARLQAVTDGEILSADEVAARDERRSDELEALESVFGDRFSRSKENPDHISITIPHLDPDSSLNTPDDLTLHLVFPASAVASPYPSARYPTCTPTFYVTSTTLPSYIRLHLHSLLLTLFHRPDREDLRSTLESGEGGVAFALVELLENEWEAVVQEPPSVGVVTQFLVPKLPPPKKVEGEVVQKKAAPKRTFNHVPRREPSKEEHERLRMSTEEWQRSEKFKKVLEGRMGLPAWKSKQEVLDALEKHRVLVVVGETGSGKTTQLPQFILDHEIASNRGCSTNILVTQPRRVSALGVAARVASERLEDVDKGAGLVGYAIRGERRAGRDTRLLFCTTGVLLRRLSAGGDGNLEGVSHVIVDEVHERSVDGDFLLLELRELLRRNKKIKVVLMSATINHLTFTTYFGGAPLLEIVGRTFPVEDHYLEDIIKHITYRPTAQRGGGGGGKPQQRQTQEQMDAFRNEYEERGLDGSSIQILDTVARSDKLDAALVAAVAAHAIAESEGEKGGVLIFCPGVMEITQTMTALRGMSLGPVEIMPLHAQLSSQEQKRVFLPTSNRKIVVATNIAETSITIDDITIVVDSGKVKETQFEAERGMQLLVEVLTSRAASRQRKGRAGRTKPGKCYKVFTRRMENNKMLPFPIPEILRTPLEALFLQVKAMREEEDVKAYLSKAIDPPKVEQMDSAWQTLMDLGAVEGEHATSKLTALGRHMSTIPVDLRLAKMLVLASIFKCLDPVLSIAAILSSKPLFISPIDKREESRQARSKFVTANSDLLTDCRAYTECSQSGGYAAQRSFCETNFLSQSSVRDITTLRSDFLGALSDIGFIPPYSSRGSLPALNVNSSNENLIKSILLGGLFPRIAKVNKPKAKFEQMQQGSLLKDHAAKEIKLFDRNERVFLHPGSVLFGEAKIPSGFLTYWAKNMTTKVFLRDATEVPLYGILLFGGKVTVNHFAAGLMVGDGWVKMKAWTRIGVLVNQLRRLLDASLEAQFDDPSVAIGGNEEVIKTMLALLARDGLAPNS